MVAGDGVVSIKQAGPLASLILNRPPANSYNLQFVQELTGCVETIAQQDDIRVVIVQSALEKFFSGGADVKAFAQNSLEANLQLIQAEHDALELIERTPKVFIAMIAAHCLGGGLEIALACDLRFAADADYRLGVPEVNLGLMPGNGGTQRLPRLIGKSRALDLMVTGRALSPREAAEWGLVDRLFPPAELEEQTTAYAQALADGPALAIGSIKLAVNQGLELPLHEALAHERALTARLFASEDGREGVAAFAAKRKPAFKGK